MGNGEPSRKNSESKTHNIWSNIFGHDESVDGSVDNLRDQLNRPNDEDTGGGVNPAQGDPGLAVLAKRVDGSATEGDTLNGDDDKGESTQEGQRASNEVEAKPVVKEKKDPIDPRIVNQVVADADARVAANQAVYDAAEKSRRMKEGADNNSEDKPPLSDDQLKNLDKKLDELQANGYHVLSEDSAQAKSDEGGRSKAEKVPAKSANNGEKPDAVESEKPDVENSAQEPKPDQEDEATQGELSLGGESEDSSADQKKTPEQGSAEWTQGELELDKRPVVEAADVAKAYADYTRLHGDERKAKAKEIREMINNGYDDRMEKKYSRQGDKNADGEVRGELKADENLPIPFGRGMNLKVSAKGANAEQIDEAIAAWNDEIKRDAEVARDTENDAKRHHHIEKMWSSREKLEALKNLAAEKAIANAATICETEPGLVTDDEKVKDAKKKAVDNSQKEAANRLLASEGFKMTSDKGADGGEVKFPDMNDPENIAKLNKIIRGKDKNGFGQDKDLADLSLDEIEDLVAAAQGVVTDGLDFIRESDDADANLEQEKAIANALSRKELLRCYEKIWRKDEIEAREKAKQEEEQAKQNEGQGEGESTPEEAAEAAAKVANELGDTTEVLPPADQPGQPEGPGDAPEKKEKPTEPEKIYSPEEIEELAADAKKKAAEAAERLQKARRFFGSDDRRGQWHASDAAARAALEQLAVARGGAEMAKFNKEHPDATKEEIAAARVNLSQKSVDEQIKYIYERTLNGEIGGNVVTKVWRKIGAMNSKIENKIDLTFGNKWMRMGARVVVFGAAGVAASAAVGAIGLTGIPGAIAGVATASAVGIAKLNRGYDDLKDLEEITEDSLEKKSKGLRTKVILTIGGAALGGALRLLAMAHHVGAVAGNGAQHSGGGHHQSLSDLNQNTSGSRAQLHVDGGNVSTVPNAGDLLNVPGAGNISKEEATNLVLRAIRGELGNGEARKQALGASYDWVQGMVNKVAAAHGGNVLNVHPQDVTPGSLGLR